jgi:aminoglycoside phosphotransferase (APT) family kinase protein
MSVRLPRHEGAIEQAATELAWLPRLAPLLPLAVPEPLAVGEPDFGYPWRWAVTRWLDGSVATVAADTEETAAQLAGFLGSLQRIAPAERLAPGPHPQFDKAPLAEREQATRAAIKAVAGDFDAPAMTAVWEAARQAPAWDRQPVWFHGDFHTGNLLTAGGRLSAVIDFGNLGMGDPAVDLMIAWTLMGAGTRAVFRAELGCDDATWARGRGWALATGLNAYTAYAATRPRVAKATRRQIAAAIG